MALPLMLYTQKVLGLSPTRSALLLIPMAVLSGALARPVGMLVDRVHPRYLAGFGLLCMVIAPGLAEFGDGARPGDPRRWSCRSR